MDNTNTRTSIKVYTFTYNPLRLQHVSIFFWYSSESLHQTSAYCSPEFTSNKRILCTWVYIKKAHIVHLSLHQTSAYCSPEFISKKRILCTWVYIKKAHIVHLSLHKTSAYCAPEFTSNKRILFTWVYIKQAHIVHLNLHQTSKYYHMLIWCKLPEDNLKKIEKFWSLSGLYVKVYTLIFVYLLILSIKLFIN